ncbi:MAG: ATP-dependent RecD-like DNA helicase [Clostridia bacterium]|nr:ATP-dependent RecD-like DNA helicase [Clostridia bacterium]
MEEGRIEGIVERVVYHNAENGYAVIEISAEGELYTVTGTMPAVEAGESIIAFGRWYDHPSFGTQFQAKTVEHIRPQTIEAILRYLSAGAIRGIGPSTARKLVETFGENTLEVMEKEPERVAALRGVTAKKANEWSEALAADNGMREMLLFLGRYGISPNEAVRIYRAFGAGYLDRIEENPFCLCAEGLGIDFFRADSIAQMMDRPQDFAGRIRAGILYVLRHNLSNGHTCLPRGPLVQAAVKLLGVESGRIEEAIDDMKELRFLFSHTFGDTEYLYLERYFLAEQFIAERIRFMKRYPAASISGIENHIRSVEERTGITYAELQKEAIRRALGEGLLILTGGPGTGKTTTLQGIIRILKEKGETVLLAAPTGRAAKRMSELTGEDAKTLHRLLQAQWDEEDKPVFAKNEKNLLECDAMVVDELSMVDVILFESLLRALPIGCRLILVGDSDQLPSVGAGNVLGDLIASKEIPTVALREVFRQALESNIIRSAHQIVRGEMPVLRNRDGDFFFLERKNAQEIGKTILELITARLPQAYGFDAMSEIQVLTPGRKGPLGTAELSPLLQSALNPAGDGKRELTLGSITFREGDKVIQTKNNYQLPFEKDSGEMGEGIFNGDIGTLRRIDKAAGYALVEMDDRLVTYDFEQMRELELAYALTVHKSQGNEFEAVILPAFAFAPQLLYRNLLYTAVTRAKKLLIIVGEEEILARMIGNDKKTRRFSGLRQLLEQET